LAKSSQDAAFLERLRIVSVISIRRSRRYCE
jgi:hypothetical protein